MYYRIRSHIGQLPSMTLQREAMRRTAPTVTTQARLEMTREQISDWLQRTGWQTELRELSKRAVYLRDQIQSESRSLAEQKKFERKLKIRCAALSASLMPHAIPICRRWRQARTNATRTASRIRAYQEELRDVMDRIAELRRLLGLGGDDPTGSIARARAGYESDFWSHL